MPYSTTVAPPSLLGDGASLPSAADAQQFLRFLPTVSDFNLHVISAMVVAISPSALANAQTVRMNGGDNGETIQIITAATDAQGNLVTGGE